MANAVLVFRAMCIPSSASVLNLSELAFSGSLGYYLFASQAVILTSHLALAWD